MEFVILLKPFLYAFCSTVPYLNSQDFPKLFYFGKTYRQSYKSNEKKAQKKRINYSGVSFSALPKGICYYSNHH